MKENNAMQIKGKTLVNIYTFFMRNKYNKGAFTIKKDVQ